MQPAICTEHLTKQYGPKRGVTDLNFVVQPGEVFGFIGPNGAGKTTTIRQLLGFIRPTSGRAEVLGLDTQRDSRAIHRRVGYLPGELALYEQMTGKDLLAYFAHLRGGVDSEYVAQLVDQLELDPVRPIRTLSKGNKQKVGLVQAFMHRPDVLILDEPTSGLDPLVQQSFIQLVRGVKATGTTVFLSSHVLAEVEGLADRIGIIRDGQLVAIDTLASIKAQAVQQLQIRFAQPVPSAVFEMLAGVRDLVIDGTLLRCTVEGSVDAVIKAAAHFEVLGIISHEPDLEEVFLRYYKGEASHVA